MTAVASTVTVRVLLFASYAERLGSDALEMTLDNPARSATRSSGSVLCPAASGSRPSRSAP